jgi:Ca2+-binding RTX toxin-like protein
VILSFVTGGSGDDTFILRRHVSIIEGASGGTDSVRIGVTFGLTAEVENLRLTGKKNADATGNGEANIINGNSGNNVIAGGTAADTLSGGGGRDTFLYAKFDGGDTITDFRQGQDRIRIEGFTQFDSFGDLDFVKSGEDVRISFADENGADFILVENQKIGDFDKGDFLFG